MTTAEKVATECKTVAETCQQYARALGNHQNDKLELKARDAQKVVTALLNAGNILSALDRFDPAGAAPEGWTRRTAYDAQGRACVTFEQATAAEATVPPPVEGYGHPDPSM